MFRKIQHIHFVGIGGAGMSGIAEVLLTLGYHVTGSDLHESESVRRIRALGGTVFIGHAASNIGNAQVVVVSSAVPPTNPEVVAAKARVIPVIPRAEMLAELMRLKYGVAIAGAHGKTTTTSLVANVLAEGGLDPTIVIGGKVNALGSHARLGRGDLLVAEADESDGSFMKLSPTVVVVTNVDREHLDHYGTMERLCETFLDFINKVPFYGLSVLCADDPYLAALLPRVTKRYLMYGLTPSADLVGADVQLHVGVAAFSARLHGEPLGRFKVAMPGIHNVRNALAAIAVGLELGVTLPHIDQALAGFKGVERRFQVLGEKGGVLVVDDYGHHPTEIKATLAAAKNGWGRRLVVLFQPHRFTRTKDLLEEFPAAFKQADHLFLTDIYPAGEAPIPGVTGERLAEGIRRVGTPPLTYVPRKDQLVEAGLPAAEPEDEEALRLLMVQARKAKVPVFVLGGTNLLVRDGGIRGVVVRLTKFDRIEEHAGGLLYAQGGVGMPRLLKYALQRKLAGLEFAAGIPGTLAGAVVMNAGTRLGEMKDVVQQVRMVTPFGEMRELSADEVGFEYRRTRLLEGIIVGAWLRLRWDPTARSEATVKAALHRRKATQPLALPNAGCVFKNPEGEPAGRLIETAGLKGAQVGDAQVCPLHANFIVNRGRATARDVLALIRKVGQTVEEKTGVTLQLEVKIVGRA